MIDLVLAYDADLSAMNQDKLSPFNLAMKANNIKLLEKLSDKIRFSKPVRFPGFPSFCKFARNKCDLKEFGRRGG